MGYWQYGLGMPQRPEAELTEFWVRRHGGHWDAYCVITVLPGTDAQQQIEFFAAGLTPSDAVANLLFRICEEGSDIESPKFMLREDRLMAFWLIMAAFEEMVRKKRFAKR